MISLFVVLLTMAVSLTGIFFILRFRKNGFFEEEVGKKQPPGYHPPQRHP